MSRFGRITPQQLEDEKAESYGAGFSIGFLHGRGNAQIERERMAELNKPLPRDLNAAELMAPVKVRVLKAFYAGGGRLVEPGQVVELPRHDAISMQAIGKVELLLRRSRRDSPA